MTFVANAKVSRYLQKQYICKQLVEKFNHSFKATEQLITKTGHKLRVDVATRWSSTFIMIDHLLKLKTAVNEVTHEIQWDNLSNPDWKTLENVQILLRLFAEYTQLLTETRKVSLPSVVPAILSLIIHLEQVKTLKTLIRSVFIFIWTDI